MNPGQRVVFDCNIYLHALSAPDGPSGRCVQLAIDGALSLFISPSVLDELRDVTSRPRVIAKLRFRPERVQMLLEAIAIAATIVSDFDETFIYRRDPDDAHYVNLALAANAQLIVSRDRDLLDLMNSSDLEAADFRRRFPSLRILDPVQLLHDLKIDD
jgi:putative PIN family toxin of toxin-antitoxin system